MAEKTDASAKGGDPNPEKGGVDADALVERVGELLKNEKGFDLKEYMAGRETAAAAAAAEATGKKAQQTYDPKLTRLQNELKRQQDETTKIKRELREARLAALPEAERGAAKRLAEIEDNNAEVESERWRANEALRHAHAREFAADLRERGIKDITYEDFLNAESLDEMKAIAAEKRAEHAERRAQEAEEKGSKSKEPPNSSKQPSRGKGGVSGAGGAAGSTRNSGETPWADLKGKGLTDRNITEALRRMSEET